jgi:hypothetical protein
MDYNDVAQDELQWPLVNMKDENVLNVDWIRFSIKRHLTMTFWNISLFRRVRKIPKSDC